MNKDAATSSFAAPAVGDGLSMPAVTYEAQLSRDVGWAMSEGGRFFEGRSNVHTTLQRFATRLNELGIPYAVAGGMALFAHGYRRFTDDVDVLVTRAGLQRIHDELEGRGYIPPHATSKNLRDTNTKVKIEFLVTGDYPGDGLPKPVAFPDPTDVAIQVDGVDVVNLPTLITLKLASGMSAPDRKKDLVDVEELLKLLGLNSSFADSLDPSVRATFVEMCGAQPTTPKRYAMLWRNKWLTSRAQSIDEMIATLREATATLEAMRADGVTLDAASNVADDYAELSTPDRAIAEKYGLDDVTKRSKNEKSD